MSILNIAQARRRTIRAEVNPMDKSTVISIYPKDIYEVKPTIQPGKFEIKAGTYENPSILVVGPSSWWREIDEEQPLLEIPNSSIQIADSIVRDYCNGLLACNMADSMPGLFWIPGSITIKELKENHKTKLDKAKAGQDRYFEALVKLADQFWARTNGNPLSIDDSMRMAARMLNLSNKDWLQDSAMIAQTGCPACGTLRNPDFPICSTCKAIVDPDKAKKLGIQFAQ